MRAAPNRHAAHAFALALAFALASGPAARGKDEVQPDRLDFGTVRLGNRVQGSVRIFLEPKEVEGKAAKVEAPAFVRVDDVKVGTQQYGPNTRGYCDIAVTILTESAGEKAGAMRMTIGDRVVSVPVRARVKPRAADAVRVLVADTPFQKFSTSDAGLFDPWLRLVDRADLDVSYVEVRRGGVLDGVDLRRYEVVLLGEMGLIRLTPADVTGLTAFARSGGRVIVTANHFFGGTVAKANELLLPFGLEMQDKEGPVGSEEFTLDPTDITPCPLTEGVKSLHFRRASPTDVRDPDRTMVLASVPREHGGHFVAIGLAGDGEVVALGVSLWWSWVTKADNAVLMENLLRKRPKK